MRFNQKIFVANWKLNKTLTESKEFCQELKGYTKDQNVLIAPSFVNIHPLKSHFHELKFGAQNVSSHEQGAYTGEVSASMLKDIGVDFCILGHSERRHVFHETDADISMKMKNLIQNDIMPIFCIGETFQQREQGLTYSTLKMQIDQGLSLVKNFSKELIVAYEPVWAIGSSLPATPEVAAAAIDFIQKLIIENMPSSSVKFLYGGSVNASNIDDFLAQKNIHGVLVGGASLDLKTFKKFLK